MCIYRENDHILKINEFDLRDIQLDELEDIIKNLNGNVEFVSFRLFISNIFDSNSLEEENR